MYFCGLLGNYKLPQRSLPAEFSTKFYKGRFLSRPSTLALLKLSIDLASLSCVISCGILKEMFKDKPSIIKLHSTLALRTFRDNGLPDNTDSSQPGTNKLPARRSDREHSAKRCEQKKTTTRGHLTELPLLQSLADHRTQTQGPYSVRYKGSFDITHC